MWDEVESAKEIAEAEAKKKPVAEMTSKEKSLEDKKRKRREREQLEPGNFHREENRAMRYNKDKIPERILAKQQTQEFENQVLRDALHEVDFQNYERVALLAGNSTGAMPVPEQVELLHQKIRKTKSELAFLETQHALTKNIVKSKLAGKLNLLNTQLHRLESQSGFGLHMPTIPAKAPMSE
jgi:hypothetical protein